MDMYETLTASASLALAASKAYATSSATLVKEAAAELEVARLRLAELEVALGLRKNLSTKKARLLQMAELQLAVLRVPELRAAKVRVTQLEMLWCWAQRAEREAKLRVYIAVREAEQANLSANLIKYVGPGSFYDDHVVEPLRQEARQKALEEALRKKSARIIWKQFKTSMSDPKYALCRKRLLAEFADM